MWIKKCVFQADSLHHLILLAKHDNGQIQICSLYFAWAGMHWWYRKMQITKLSTSSLFIILCSKNKFYCNEIYVKRWYGRKSVFCIIEDNKKGKFRQHFIIDVTCRKGGTKVGAKGKTSQCESQPPLSPAFYIIF